MSVNPAQDCRRREIRVNILEAVDHTFQRHAVLILVNQYLSNHINIYMIAGKDILKRMQSIMRFISLVIIRNSTFFVDQTKQLKNMLGNAPIQFIKNPVADINLAGIWRDTAFITIMHHHIIHTGGTLAVIRTLRLGDWPMKRIHYCSFSVLQE